MIKSVKSHAKDYLLEHKAKKETPKWLGLLIQKAIDTNGKVSDRDKEQVFTELLKENDLVYKADDDGLKINETNINQEEVISDLTNQTLTLHKITHIKGVNALIPSQSIIFSPSCTIIYGLNGTGKSGYFRIINELAGGDKAKSIVGNIHKQGDVLLDVDVDFLLDGQNQKPYKWQNKNMRGITPFDQIKVFDSEYLPIFLDERESSINIEPLGLNLFKTITTTIDEFKEKLDQTKQQQEKEKPDLQTLIDVIHSDELQLLLQKSSLTEEEEQLLNNTFLPEDAVKLAELKQQKTTLEKNNKEDSKKVLNQEKKEFDDLKDHLINLKTNLKALTKDISAAIKDYIEKKKTRDERIKQFETLKNMPSQNTEEWQTFIESAKDYGAKIEQSVFNKDEQCVYCHQPLGKKAIKIVQAYSEYLGDQSQQDLKDAVDKIEKLKGEITDVSVEFSFSENLKKTLSDAKNGQNQDYKILVDKALKEAKNQKTSLTESLKDKILISGQYSLGLFQTDEKLISFSNEKQNFLDDLQQSELQRKEKNNKLEAEINRLEDRQNISKWKVKIESYFTCCQSVQKYSTINQAISTTKITNLGNKAHNDLLTESIRRSFEKELKALGKDIEVTLDSAGAGKGTVFTKLKILGNDICDILSDGEQKAAGLALFLAEIEIQNNGYPIVFDDPVTSIDHEVADSLAQKLMRISSNRQIIIFTHNKLFYDSLVYWGNNLKDDKNNKTHHVCKNYTQKGCSGKGCHVYTYRVDREAKDRTGRIFESQNESCDYFIKKAENEIKGDYSLSCVTGYLKSAIEYFIDEKVLLSTGLMKDRLRGVGVPWENLEKIESKKSDIKKLKDFWDDLSNRGTHATQNSKENPLKTEDLNKIIEFLKS